MAARLISIADLSAEQLDRWRRLADRAAEPNPFFEPYWVLATVRRSGAFEAHLLVVEHDGDWLACAPVRRRGAAPLTVLQSQCDEYCFLGTPLVERDAVDEAVEALLRMASEGGRLLVLSRLALDGPVGASIRELVASHPCEVVLERRQDRAAAALPQPDPPSKEVRERARLARRMQSELGTDVALRDRSHDPAAIEDFLRLEAASWEGRAGTAAASRPADEAFVRQVCTALRDAGRLEVLELTPSEGPPLAISCAVTGGDTVFAFKIAFDERYRRAAPGVQLIYANRDAFYASGRRLFDSCAAPDSEVVNRALPHRRPMATLVIAPTGVRGALARGAARAAATMHARRHRRSALRKQARAA